MIVRKAIISLILKAVSVAIVFYAKNEIEKMDQ